jgi:hypothetical protein
MMDGPTGREERAMATRAKRYEHKVLCVDYAVYLEHEISTAADDGWKACGITFGRGEFVVLLRRRVADAPPTAPA